jgi:hypothetical protein
VNRKDAMGLQPHEPEVQNYRFEDDGRIPNNLSCHSQSSTRFPPLERRIHRRHLREQTPDRQRRDADVRRVGHS